MFAETPFVARGVVDWKQLKWTLDDWERALETGGQGTKLPLRKGFSRCSREPHWERASETCDVTIPELFKILKTGKPESEDCWYYFDYKHLAQWFTDSNMLEDICWGVVGYPDKTGRDSTLWMGTEGAHTPCHMDTYGFNIVAQLYGRKMWILFPPSETKNLKPTRVPYEESSVYSGINFACGCNSVAGIGEVRMIILEPGDVLFVPERWWHYVENLSTAISINIWVPVETDDESRLEESLAKCIVSSVTRDLQPEDRLKLLNPNEEDLGSEVNLSEISWCLNQCSKCKDSIRKKKDTSYSFLNITAEEVPRTSVEHLKKLLKEKCCLEKNVTLLLPENSEKKVKINDIINAFCHPEVLKLVKEKLQSSVI